MAYLRPYCLTISGFDPSGGAGMLADIKTFEANKVHGLCAVSALTFQNDSEFESVKWIEPDEILKQISVIKRKLEFDVIKIGLIENLDTLEKIIANSKLLSSMDETNCKFIWDPIVRASAGFEFHEFFEKEKLTEILKSIFLITPNVDEVVVLTGINDPMNAAQELSRHCNVFLKNVNKQGRDCLFTKEGKIYPFRTKLISKYQKHGSGCVFSSAVAANIAKGFNLHRACLKGKDYVTKFLMSNSSRLGYHKI